MLTLDRLLLRTKEAVVFLAYSYLPLTLIAHPHHRTHDTRHTTAHGARTPTDAWPHRSRSRVGERKLMRLIEASNFVATTIAQQGENETYILALHRKL